MSRKNSHRLDDLDWICPTCQNCKPWVLIWCDCCERRVWVRSAFVSSGCEYCRSTARRRAEELARLLVVTGHELDDSNRIRLAQLELRDQLLTEAKEVSILQLECSKPLLVPYIWQIPEERWEVVKRQGAKRFAWKLRKRQWKRK